MLRPISADEYDAVLRLQPALCPLAAAGDARSGARLLADAAADAAAGGLAAALRREDGQGGGGEGGALRRLVGTARGLAARLRRRWGLARHQADSEPDGRRRADGTGASGCICGIHT